MDFVSIGPDCGITVRLKSLGLQKETHFLDWLISKNIKDIIYIIKNSTNVYVSNNIICNTSVYDPGHYKNNRLPKIFSRRINRFLNILKTDDSLILVRDIYEDIEDIFQLRDAILSINPLKKFKILIINYVNKDNMKDNIYNDYIDYVYIIDNILMQPAPREKSDEYIEQVLKITYSIMSSYYDFDFDIDTSKKIFWGIINNTQANPD